MANGLNLYDLKKKLTPEVALTLPWGYIHVYNHSIQTSLLVYISGERLQDHWSSGSISNNDFPKYCNIYNLCLSADFLSPPSKDRSRASPVLRMRL